MKAKRSLEARLREAVRDEQSRRKLIQSTRLSYRLFFFLEVLTLLGAVVWVVILLAEAASFMSHMKSGNLVAIPPDALNDWSEKVEGSVVFIFLLIFVALSFGIGMAIQSIRFALLVVADEMMQVDKSERESDSRVESSESEPFPNAR